MKFKSIQAQIGVYITICSVAISVALVLSSLNSSNHVQSMTSSEAKSIVATLTKQDLKDKVQGAALSVNKKISAAISVSRTLTQAITAIIVANEKEQLSAIESKQLINLILKDNLKAFPNYLAFFAGLEPEVLASPPRSVQLPGENSEGRFIPYWSSDQGKAMVEAIVGYDDDSLAENGDRVGEFYLQPKETKQGLLVNPYPYVVNGKTHFVTSVVSPVIINNQFKGISGADISLDFVNQLAKNIDRELYHGVGEIYVVSQNGYVVGYSEQGKIGQRLDDEAIKQFVGSNDVRLVDSEQRLRASAPIRFDNMESQWNLILSVPKAAVFAKISDLDREINQVNKSARNTLIAISLLITIASVLLALFLSGKISKPIKQTVDVLDLVADGDLTQKLVINTEDETRSLADACNTFLSKTRAALTDVLQRSGEVQTAGTQLLSSAISTRTNVEEQQKNLIQLASATEQMTTTAAEVASIANQASSTTDEGKLAAHKGQSAISELDNLTKSINQEVKDTAELVRQLSDKSNQVRNVLDVIHDVAEQTNLLALNAAIEAARAGEHGRGFAVVADEVRNLAQRTQQSTGEIEVIIDSLQKSASQAATAMDGSYQHVNQGVLQVEMTQVILAEILTAIGGIHELNQQVATAAEEQSAVAMQISSGVNHINTLASDVANDTLDTEKNSHALNSVSEALVKQVALFKV